MNSFASGAAYADSPLGMPAPLVRVIPPASLHTPERVHATQRPYVNLQCHFNPHQRFIVYTAGAGHARCRERRTPCCQDKCYRGVRVRALPAPSPTDLQPVEGPWWNGAGGRRGKRWTDYGAWPLMPDARHGSTHPLLSLAR